MRVAYAIYQRNVLAVFTSPSVRDEMYGKNLDFSAIGGRKVRQLFHGRAPSQLCNFDSGGRSMADCWFLPISGRAPT